MKSYLMKLLFLLAFISLLNVNLFAQTDDEEDYEEETTKEYVPSDIIKVISFDAGWGAEKLGLALGFRYWNLGVSFGVAGLGNTLPDHRNERLISGTPSSTEKYPTIAVTTDLYYFYDINDEFTAFGNFGYSVGTDTVLARKDNNDSSLYLYGTENNAAFTFGLGLQYFLEQWIGIGVGYHTRRGIFAQFNYFWF